MDHCIVWYMSMAVIWVQSDWKRLKTLQVLIAVVLGVLWSPNLPATTPAFSFFDLFAGQSEATRAWYLGICSLPLLFPSANDILLGLHVDMSARRWTCCVRVADKWISTAHRGFCHLDKIGIARYHRLIMYQRSKVGVAYFASDASGFRMFDGAELWSVGATCKTYNNEIFYQYLGSYAFGLCSRWHQNDQLDSWTITYGCIFTGSLVARPPWFS